MRRYHLIVVIVVALLGGVAALAITRSPVLGLDLQGGSEIVFEAVAPPGATVDQEGLDRSVEVMRNRIDAFGVSEPEIRTQGDDQIVIELPGVRDPGRIAELVGQTAQLQFYDLEADLVPPSISADGFPIASETLYPILKDLQGAAESGTPSAWYLYSESKERLAGPEPSRQAILERLGLEEAPEGSEFLAVPSDRVIVTCGPDQVACPGVGTTPTRTYYYVFKYQPTADPPVPELTGEDLKGSGTRQDFDPQTGQPVVLMEFTDEGGEKFEQITRELSVRGQQVTQRLGSEVPLLQHFAIVLDGEIQSFPTIDFTDPTVANGISGGRAQITGLDSVREAKDLATVLQTGALPYTFVQIDRTDISATLGEDSLREAVVAAIGGLAAVAIFLLLVYRFLGLIAIAGLAIYGALLYGAILLFNVTLTLPGFAGLALTIGVAADANIVIFERIKEEVRAGRSVRAAITQGYTKGFGTIVDANVVTMITAFVLFAVATGTVKGFALMLLIGTAMSMLTAVAATRAMLGLLSGFRWFDNPSFMGATAQKIPDWQKIDFVGKRKLWFALSAVVLLLCVVSLAWQGLNLGIDFRGGSQLTFQTAQPQSVERVRSVVSEVIPASAVVQGRGEAQGDRYTSFNVRTESLSQAEQDELQSVVEEQLGAEATGVRNVSGSFSEQILRNAILAIVVSLLLIVVYVSFRFQWKFAVPVLIALAHDIVLTLGVYSVTQREMTSATVAAMLTILGYSLYDTVIIFDRVRENIPLMRNSSFARIANQSLWETIRRSLATSFITLLPLASLYVFGGDTLKDFAFALLIGIASGAYSTIFIATPALAVIKEREPDYAKRKGQVEPDEKELILAPAAEPASRRPRRRRGRAAEADAAAVALAEAPPVADEDGTATAPEEPDAEPAEQEPPPEPAAGPRPIADPTARREARRKRRRARPHGRAR